MANTTITGKLEHVERLPLSRNGNPRFTLTIAGHLHNTAADHALNYEVENFRIGTTVTVTLNGRGSVIDMITA